MSFNFQMTARVVIIRVNNGSIYARDFEVWGEFLSGDPTKVWLAAMQYMKHPGPMFENLSRAREAAAVIIERVRQQNAGPVMTTPLFIEVDGQACTATQMEVPESV